MAIYAGQRITAGLLQSISPAVFALAQSVTVANTATEANIATGVLPASWLVANSCWELIAWGTFSDTSTAPTMKFLGYLQGTAVVSRTFTPAISQSNRSWMTCCTFLMESPSIADAILKIGINDAIINANVGSDYVATAAGVSVGTAGTVALNFQWGTANAANTITCTDFLLRRAF